MVASHRARVEELLSEAEAAHRALLTAVPPDVGASLPVDAQGITRAIDHIAIAAGFSADERSRLVLPHAVNPAVLHARVFGTAPLTAETVLGAFVEGARVRAGALITLANAVDDQSLVGEVRALLIDNPLPTAEADHRTPDTVGALRSAYAAQEHAAVLIAGRLDALA
ncbi:MAG TPA: hypothetical protein VHV75_12660 [Solirubrobacteraceae bacterium]|jgi:hypothetical protein|nr:hypothetical protein [Solirubrobacteraceae bacterium]